MKKKGLIISTVVMVVVLIAALTTTTFAWFTATATASVDEMTIETQSSKGLTISVFDGTKYYNGDVDFGESEPASGTPGKWTGDAEGQGASVAFDTTGMKFYGASGDGFKMYTAGEKPSSTVGTSATTLYKATANYDYFEAVLALQTTETTEAAEDVKMSISFTQTGPIATAARIAVYAYKTANTAPAEADFADISKWDEKFVLAPFGKAQQAGPTWNNTGSTANTYLKVKGEGSEPEYASGQTKADNFENGTFTNLIIDGTAYSSDDATAHKNTSADETSLGQVTSQGDMIYIKLIIWYEGEDPQCIATNAGAGLKVSIAFTKGEAA